MPYEARPLLEALRRAEQLPIMDTEVETPFLDDLELEENETLHLPPTPSQLAIDEGYDFKEAWQAQERAMNENEEDEKVYQRIKQPPPKHHSRRLSKDKQTPQQQPVAESSTSVQPEPMERTSSSEYSAAEEEPVPRIPTPPSRASLDKSRSQTPQDPSQRPVLPPRRRPVPPPPTQVMSNSSSPSEGKAAEAAKDAPPPPGTPPPSYPQGEQSDTNENLR